VLKLLGLRGRGPWASNKDDVPARPRTVLMPNCLTQNTTTPIPKNGAAEFLARDKRDAAGLAASFRRLCYKHYEQGMGRSLCSAEDPVNLARGLYGAHLPNVPVPARRLGAQNLASLATTSGENRAAATGGHASAKAVRLCTLPNVRLVCTLHCSSLMRAGFGAKPDEYMRAVRVVSNATRQRARRFSPEALIPVQARRTGVPFPRCRRSEPCSAECGKCDPICGYCGKRRTHACGTCG
jgi:hypothetical protein